jgi:tetratricopeptide (TPR) repeat protein
LGRVTEAQQFAQEALDAQPRVFVAHVNALWLLAKIATHPSRFDPETGATYYGKVLAWAAEHKTRPLIAHCHLGLGKLYRRTGQREQAHEHLIIATTLYREMDMPFWLEQAEAEARELV